MLIMFMWVRYPHVLALADCRRLLNLSTMLLLIWLSNQRIDTSQCFLMV